MLATRAKTSAMELRSQQKQQHAAVTGSPGEGARNAGLYRAMWPIPILLLLAGVVIGLAVPYDLPPLPAVLGLLGMGLVLAGALVWSNRRLRRHLKGAEGEERIARTLSFLPSDYFVFHSLWLPGDAIGPKDVDHLVVGPTGVYALETKNWTGEISVEEDLQLHVRPVLCFAGRDAALEAEASGVLVCDGGNLLEVLQAERGEQLEAGKIDRIVEALQER